MKPILLHCVGAIVLSFSIAACIPAVEAPVASTSEPAPRPVQTSAPAPAPAHSPSPAASSAPQPAPTSAPATSPILSANWMDEPRTTGDWRYAQESGETYAIYATGGESPHAMIRCDLASRRITLGRFSASDRNQQMRIYTETTTRTLDAGPRASTYPLVAAELSANDRLLDAMAVTKGNFAMQVSGMPALYLPGWAEVTRVIEDCR